MTSFEWILLIGLWGVGYMLCRVELVLLKILRHLKPD